LESHQTHTRFNF